MSSDEKLTPERAVHLLRAKGAELENKVLRGLGPTDIEVRYLAADIALIAQLLADHIEANQTVRITGPEASGTKYAQDSPIPGYLDSILEVTEFKVGSKEEAEYVAALKAECDAYLGRRQP